MPRFSIRAMTERDARSIAAWRYPQPYAFYDADQDPGDLAELLDPSEWGARYFAADDADRSLAGFLVYKVTAGDVEIGLGLRPDLAGIGLGASFLHDGLRFAERAFRPSRYTLAVAAFNARAITVYERAGFVEVERYDNWTNGALHAFVRMARGPLLGGSC